MTAKRNTPEGDRLDVLVTLVVALRRLMQFSKPYPSATRVFVDEFDAVF